MHEAKSLKCPSCGGVVSAKARHCNYCRSPVLTLRCLHCFHMNVADDVHCSGCGRPLGLEPVGDPGDLRCPDCGLPLDVFHGGPGKLRDCSRCGGQFVEHALLRDLIERREIYGIAAPRRTPKSNPLSDPVKYRPCPACSRLMARKNFGNASGIIVDICHAHGIWFDAGELPRVLAFVESGGLAISRRREMEEQRRQRREASTIITAPRVGPSYDGPSLGDVAVSLLEMVARFFRTGR